jgi:hypothetical protein
VPGCACTKCACLCAWACMPMCVGVCESSAGVARATEMVTDGTGAGGGAAAAARTVRVPPKHVSHAPLRHPFSESS